VCTVSVPKLIIMLLVFYGLLNPNLALQSRSRSLKINRSFNFGVSDLPLKNAIMTNALCSSTSSEKLALRPGGLAISLETFSIHRFQNDLCPDLGIPWKLLGIQEHGTERTVMRRRSAG
jgi:hypothetical protein